MARSLLLTFAFVLASAVPARASDIGAVKCGPNQDRVWVYESLSSFDVETRLKCNETVEIISRVRGYVKIRTASGVEGYVTDAAFPDLPALPPDDADRPVASLATRAAAVNPTPRANTMPPPPVSPAIPAAPAPVTEPTPAAQPTAAQPVAAPPPAPVASKAAAPGTIAAGPASSSHAPASTANAKADVKPASAVAPPAHAKPRQKGAMPTVVAEPPAPRKAPAAKPAPAPAVPTQSAQSTISVPQPAPAAAMVPAKATVTPAGAAMLDAAAISPKGDITLHEPARDPDLDEYPETKPENESADPACRIFFSAYGLAPAQYRWMVDSRKKEFEGICPAPDLAHVDFVILFAHDSDTFNSSMPAAVHTDRGGFSDFNPISTMDDALQSASELDKARYEFVWVFHTKRGTFDPSKFSLRRRPLFTTDAKGSHAASRAVEDAFHFIDGQGNPER